VGAEARACMAGGNSSLCACGTRTQRGCSVVPVSASSAYCSDVCNTDNPHRLPTEAGSPVVRFSMPTTGLCGQHSFLATALRQAGTQSREPSIQIQLPSIRIQSAEYSNPVGSVFCLIIYKGLQPRSWTRQADTVLVSTCLPTPEYAEGYVK